MNFGTIHFMHYILWKNVSKKIFLNTIIIHEKALKELYLNEFVPFEMTFYIKNWCINYFNPITRIKVLVFTEREKEYGRKRYTNLSEDEKQRFVVYKKFFLKSTKKLYNNQNLQLFLWLLSATSTYFYHLWRLKTRILFLFYAIGNILF